LRVSCWRQTFADARAVGNPRPAILPPELSRASAQEYSD
jgi:hypothetical protein